MSRVAHVMVANPTTIRTTASAAEAAELMQRLGLRHLPVVDESGRLVGMLSDRDLRGPMIGFERTDVVLEGSTFVDRLMTRQVVTAMPHEEVGIVARRIIEHRIGAVPIIAAERKTCAIPDHAQWTGRQGT